MLDNISDPLICRRLAAEISQLCVASLANGDANAYMDVGKRREQDAEALPATHTLICKISTCYPLDK